MKRTPIRTTSWYFAQHRVFFSRSIAIPFLEVHEINISLIGCGNKILRENRYACFCPQEVRTYRGHLFFEEVNTCAIFLSLSLHPTQATQATKALHRPQGSRCRLVACIRKVPTVHELLLKKEKLMARFMSVFQETRRGKAHHVQQSEYPLRWQRCRRSQGRRNGDTEEVLGGDPTCLSTPCIDYISGFFVPGSRVSSHVMVLLIHGQRFRSTSACSTEPKFLRLRLPQLYAESKAMGEKAVLEACSDSLLTVAIAPHQIYGPRCAEQHRNVETSHLGVVFIFPPTVALLSALALALASVLPFPKTAVS